MMQRENITLLHGDCLELMKDLLDNSIDLIVTDPPYFKVKGEFWDNQWSKPEIFLAWLDTVLDQFKRILKPNGSLYLFASSKMASRIERLVSERMRILNHIVWVKPNAGGAEKGAKAGTIRSYVPQTERIIFACHFNPLGDALRKAMKKSKLTSLELNRKAFERNTGLISLWLCNKESHGSCEPSCSDWVKAMQACGVNASESDYYSLARPFFNAMNFSDVWNYNPVRPYQGKHPCEKPLGIMEQCITSSSQVGSVVFDPFMGSGTTGVACVNTGRNFIGMELDASYFEIAKNRILNA